MHERLETYLVRVEQRLHLLPLEKRYLEIQELRGHLQAMVAYRMERGESEDEAVTTALQQFGSPRSVGNSLRQAWWGRESWWRLPIAMATTYIGFVMAYLLGFTGAARAGDILMSWLTGLHVAGGPDAWFRMGYQAVTYAFIFLIVVAPPFLAGCCGGAIAPRRTSDYWVLSIGSMTGLFCLQTIRGDAFGTNVLNLLVPISVVLACAGARWMSARRTFPVTN